MKLLCLYRYDPQYAYDDWLHMHFMADVAKQADLVCYGPGLSEPYPRLSPIAFDPKLAMPELLRQTRAEAVLVMTKSRMFYGYHPEMLYGERENSSWLPAGFAESRLPKLVLEEDYHYERDDRWYQEQGIDLILQRHYYSAQRQDAVPMAWFPFSVNTQVFRPSGLERVRKICLAGAATPHIYIHRAAALAALEPTGLLDNMGRRTHKIKRRGKLTTEPLGGVYGQAYVRCLQQYVAHLSGTSKYRICPAKMFEIMASGSVLFTNYEPFFAELFPDNAYETYRPDSVVEQARRLIAEPRYTAELAQKGLACIKAKHTSKIRIGQLLDHVREVRDDRHLERLPSGPVPRLSIVIPWAAGDLQREIHFAVVQECLNQQTMQDFELIVGEQLQSPHAAPTGLCCRQGRTVAIYDGQQRPFNRSWCINAAIRKARADWIAVLDADIVLPDHYLAAALSFAEQNQDVGVFCGYTRLVLEKGRDNPVERIVSPRDSSLLGGNWFASRSFYWRMGGMHEDYFGYGGEDNDAYVRAQTLCRDIPMLPVQLRHRYHHWHTRWPPQPDRLATLARTQAEPLRTIAGLQRLPLGNPAGPSLLAEIEY